MNKKLKFLLMIVILIFFGIIAVLYVNAAAPQIGEFQPLPEGYKKGNKIFNTNEWTAGYLSATEFSPDYMYSHNGVCSFCGNSGAGYTTVPVKNVNGTKTKAYYQACMNKTGDALDINGNYYPMQTAPDGTPRWLSLCGEIYMGNNIADDNGAYTHERGIDEHAIGHYFEYIEGFGYIIRPIVFNNSTEATWHTKGTAHWHMSTDLYEPMGEEMIGFPFMCTNCATNMQNSKTGGINKNLTVHVFNAYEILPISYNVRFNANGGTGTMSDMTSLKWQGRTINDYILNYYYFYEYKLSKNTFTKDNYTFIGWNTKADGTGDWYLDESVVRDLTSTDGATVTLYAQWERKDVKITFDTQGGSYNYTGTNNIFNYQKNNGYLLSKPDNTEYWLGDGTYYYDKYTDDKWDSSNNRSKGAYVLTPEKSMSVFLGWYKADGTKVFDELGRCLIKNVMLSNYFTEDITLYAKYSTMNKITFNANGGNYSYTGTHTVLSFQKTNGYLLTVSGDGSKWLGTGASWYGAFAESNWDSTNNYSIAQCVLPVSKSDAIFLGWYTSDGTKVFDSVGRCVIKNVMLSSYFTSDNTLYARYSSQIKITFDKGGGSYVDSISNDVVSFQKNNNYLLSYSGTADRWLGDGTNWYAAFIDSYWNNENNCSAGVYVLPVEKSGNIFIGWFTSDGTKIFDEYGRCVVKDVMLSQYFTANTTLYARYSTTVKVYINCDGGTYGRLDEPRGSICYYFSRFLQDNGYFYHGKYNSWGIWVNYTTSGGYSGRAGWSIAYKDNYIFDPPKKEGYIYKGVFTEPNGQGEQIFAAGSGICVCEDLLKGTKFAQDTTLYVYWQPQRFTITWDYNKPTTNSSITCNPKPDKTDVQYTTAKWNGITYPQPTLQGYSFEGWYKDETRYDTRTDNIKQEDRVDITLKAKWEPITYTVIIHPNKPTSLGSWDDVSISINKPDGWEYENATEKSIKKTFTYDSTTLPTASKLTGISSLDASNTPYLTFGTGDLYTTVNWYLRNRGKVSGYWETQGSNGQASGTYWENGAKNLTTTANAIVHLYVAWRTRFIPLTATINKNSSNEILETTKLDWTKYIGETDDKFELYSSQSSSLLGTAKVVDIGNGWSKNNHKISNTDTSESVRNKYKMDVETLDEAKPDTPWIEKYDANNHKLTIKSQDNGTQYWFTINGYTSDNKFVSKYNKDKQGDLPTVTVTTGIKGFRYYLDDIEATDISKFTESNTTFKSASSSFDFDLAADNPNNKKYLHIIAVDKAVRHDENKSKILTIELPHKNTVYENNEYKLKITLNFEVGDGHSLKTGEPSYKIVEWKFKGWSKESCMQACNHYSTGYKDYTNTTCSSVSTCSVCSGSEVKIGRDVTGYSATSDVILKTHYTNGKTTLVKVSDEDSSLFIGWFTKQLPNGNLIDDKAVYYGGGQNWEFSKSCIHTVNTAVPLSQSATEITLYAVYNKKPQFINLYEGLFFEGQKITYEDLLELIGSFDYEDNYQKLQEENIKKYFDSLKKDIENEIGIVASEKDNVIESREVFLHKYEDIEYNPEELDELNKKIDALQKHLDGLFKQKEQLEKATEKELKKIPERMKLLKINIAEVNYYGTRNPETDEPLAGGSYNYRTDILASNGLKVAKDINSIKDTLLQTSTEHLGKFTVTYQIHDSGILFKVPGTPNKEKIPNSDITVDYIRTCQINFNYNPLIYTQGMIRYNNQSNTSLSDDLLSQQAVLDSEDFENNVPWWSKTEDTSLLLESKQFEINTINRLQESLIITGVEQISFNGAFEVEFEDAVEHFREDFESPELEFSDYQTLAGTYFVKGESKSIYNKKELLDAIASFKDDDSYYKAKDSTEDFERVLKDNQGKIIKIETYKVKKYQIYQALNSIYITFDAVDQWGKYASNNVSDTANSAGVDTTKKPEGYTPEFSGDNDIDKNNSPDDWDKYIKQTKEQRSTVIVFVDDGDLTTPPGTNPPDDPSNPPGEDRTLYSDTSLNSTKIEDSIRYIDEKWLNTLGKSYWGDFAKGKLEEILNKGVHSETYNINHSGGYDTENEASIKVEVNEY